MANIDYTQAQNDALKKQNMDLQKEVKQSQKEYAILDAIIDTNNAKIGQLEKEIKELKEENEKLKEVIEKRDLQLDLLDNRSIRHREYAEKYYTTLQEIKGVVTALYMNNWLQMNETARKSIQLLQELINKAEGKE